MILPNLYEIHENAETSAKKAHFLARPREHQWFLRNSIGLGGQLSPQNANFHEIMIFAENDENHENHNDSKKIMKSHDFTVILHFWAMRDPQIPMEFLREYWGFRAPGRKSWFYLPKHQKPADSPHNGEISWKYKWFHEIHDFSWVGV